LEGKDAGKQGEVTRIMRSTNRLIVAGLNFVRIHSYVLLLLLFLLLVLFTIKKMAWDLLGDVIFFFFFFSLYYGYSGYFFRI